MLLNVNVVNISFTTFTLKKVARMLRKGIQWNAMYINTLLNFSIRFKFKPCWVPGFFGIHNICKVTQFSKFVRIKWLEWKKSKVLRKIRENRNGSEKEFFLHLKKKTKIEKLAAEKKCPNIIVFTENSSSLNWLFSHKIREIAKISWKQLFP